MIGIIEGEMRVRIQVAKHFVSGLHSFRANVFNSNSFIQALFILENTLSSETHLQRHRVRKYIQDKHKTKQIQNNTGQAMYKVSQGAKSMYITTK